MTDEIAFHYVLHCPCGESLEGESEDAIVETAFAHLKDKHPQMADHYERDDILFMALKLRA